MVKESVSSIPLEETSNKEKVINVLIAALIFGFGWHIRGSGTSDPIAPMLMFLLFVGFLFYPRQKFNGLVFGLAVLLFRVMRRGWGTFVGMPTGYLAGEDENYVTGIVDDYSVAVPWWHGYMFLFFVGLAWAGLAALIIGGYNFSEEKYNYKDLIICLILYTIGFIIGLFISEALIPIIAPDEYAVYTDLKLARNYISMRDNMAFTFAIVPVLLYILLIKKDTYFVKMTVIIMLIFGFALSIADIWQWYGRINLELGLPFWSLWEYTSGFIIGALLMILFYLIPEERWKKSDTEFKFYPADTVFKKIIIFAIAHVALFLYVIGESLNGAINHGSAALGQDLELPSILIISIVVIIDIPLYILYNKGKFGTTFKEKDFQEKCLIILILFVPFAYFCYVIQFILAGTYLSLNIGHLVTWIDTISALIIEIYLIILYITKYKRR